MEDREFDGDSVNGGSSHLSSELNSNQSDMKCNRSLCLDHICQNKDTSLSTRYCCDPLHPDPGNSIYSSSFAHAKLLSTSFILHI